MFAIAEIKGHQYQVAEGDKLLISRIADAKEGEKIKFDEVLLISDKDVTLGMPFIKGAYVEMKVLAEVKADKIRVFKMKAKKRYRKTQGHRQKYTEVEVVKIATGGSPAAKPAAKKEDKPKEEKAEKKPAAKKPTAKKAPAKKPTVKKTPAKK
ncbi:50S ribosomal protein L21 [Candidatus Peregrinibacteria bacterium]|jgi:large subunit ribosomal protein L21|nr:50S ribosomal protein L21 [Candidatus Peregrinibacteria bacterium]